MLKFLSLFRPRKDDYNKHHHNKELNYDPRCGMSKEEFEWRCAQHERVCQSMPQALNELQIQLQMMRHHFLDDPESLKKWDEYESNVYHAFEWNLQSSLASPQLTPNSVLYEQLMKRKARSKTFVGMLSGRLDQLKQATRNKRLVGTAAIVASVAAGFAVGYAVGTTPWKQQQSKET